MMDDAHFRVWREKFAPLVFDWFAHHNLTWPTQTCRWGPKLSENSYKYTYRMYFSEQTDDTEAQKLVVANMDVCKPRVASAEVVSNWTEFQKCPYVKEHKVIFHPGEINKVREIPGHPHLVVTHTDAPEVYLWNLDKQPARAREQSAPQGSKKIPAPNVPDLVLVGHEEPAQFPLAASKEGPHVASGGQDKMVLLWCLDDHIESLLSSASSAPNSDLKGAPKLKPRSRLAGHTNTVEDLVFMPGTSQQLVSVGDDQQILWWDTRTGSTPTAKVENAHGKQDIQCVDWNPHVAHLIATGAQDGSLRVWDRRKAGGPRDHLYHAKCHTGGVIRLEWHPHERDVLATGGEDRAVLVWRLGPLAGGPPLPSQGEDAAADSSGGRGKSGRGGGASAARPPPELIFQHPGHRRGKVVDFQWHPAVPWTMFSVSDDAADEEMGGGSLQVWRINDMIYRPEAEVVAELNEHKQYILEGRKAPHPKPAAPQVKPDPVPAGTGVAAAGPATSKKRALTTSPEQPDGAKGEGAEEGASDKHAKVDGELQPEPAPKPEVAAAPPTQPDVAMAVAPEPDVAPAVSPEPDVAPTVALEPDVAPAVAPEPDTAPEGTAPDASQPMVDGEWVDDAPGVAGGTAEFPGVAMDTEEGPQPESDVAPGPGTDGPQEPEAATEPVLGATLVGEEAAQGCAHDAAGAATASATATAEAAAAGATAAIAVAAAAATGDAAAATGQDGVAEVASEGGSMPMEVDDIAAL